MSEKHDRINEDAMEYHDSIQSKGGRARAKKMTAQERSESASVAATARWSGKDPKPPRKVIQVSTVLDSVGKYLILCVCDDGTMWQLSNLYRENGREPFWEPFPVPPAK